MNEASGINCDIDFQRHLEDNMNLIKEPQIHKSAENMKIQINVRKRPVFEKELQSGDIDCVSCSNPGVVVHECKYKIDGITKYIENHDFSVDNTFSEDEATQSLYDCTLKPLIEFVFNGGIATCFAYGQTGSGKTHTMQGVQ